MGSLLQDLRHGARGLAKSPGFTLTTILMLGIGIGAATTVFAWIDAVLLHPIPGASDPGRLFNLETVATNGEFLANSYPDYRDYRDNLTLVAGLAAAQPAAMAIGEEDSLERAWGEMVSGNYFDVLGVRAATGRTFTRDESADKPNAFPVAVISDRLWRSHFQADPGIIGRLTRINRHELTIVGVLPPGFRGSVPGLAFDIWVPLMMRPMLSGTGEWMLRDRGTRQLVGLARLKPGVTIEQARAETGQLALRIAEANGGTNRGIGAALQPLSNSHYGAQSALRAPLSILMGACVLLLVILCANVANLLLARSVGRRREFSVRTALGAGRLRIAWQMLAESLLLAVAGGFAGVLTAMWMGQSLSWLLPPTALPVVISAVWPSPAVLGFTVLLSLGVALLAGLAPAIRSAGADVNEILSEGTRGGTTASLSHRVRGLLVVSEVALAMVALVGAAVFARSFQATARLNPGFDPNRVLMAPFQLSSHGYDLEQRKLFCRKLRERLEAAPGITAVSYSDGVPLGFEPSWWEDVRIEGYVPGTAENMKLYRNVVSPGYFSLMKIPLLEGRDFSEQDDERTQRVMIVTREFARRYFGDRDPVGRRVRGWGEWFRIVGVVGDSKYHRLSEAPLPYFYVAFRQIYRADMNLAVLVRTAASVDDALGALRREVRAIDPNIAVAGAMPLTEYIAASLYPQKVAASLLGVLGGLSILLAALGLYSVMAYGVSQRTQEIGIRVALGARPTDILRLVVAQGMSMTIAGLVAGVALAIALVRLISAAAADMVGAAGSDPLVYAGAAAFLALVAAAACLLPARRASSVDPSQSLRCQ